jgi:hypothetical protein
MANETKTSIKAAFFAVRQTNDKQGYIGAIFVTDERGIPLEFRCTQPVKPSQVQRSLYGNNLESHISYQLSGRPLLDSLTNRPVFCIVEARSMLGLREFVNLPVVHVQRLTDTLGAVQGKSNSAESVKRLDNEQHTFQPMSVMTHPSFENDYDGVKTALEVVFQHVDLLEPFQRITTALQALAERDQRFR